MTNIEIGKTYESESNAFREAWNNGRVAAEQAHIAVNTMVRILKQDYDDWSMRKVLYKIADDHKNLAGFSIQNLYKYLDDENRELLQSNSVHNGTQNNSKKDPSPKDPSPPEENPLEVENEFLKEENANLKDALKKTEQFKPATALEQLPKVIESAEKEDERVHSWLKNSADGIGTFYYDSYGIELFKNRELPQLKNSGAKVFRRLYFEV